MDDYLNKELDKNVKLREVLKKQLDIDKENFINKIKTDLGKTIKEDFKEQKVIKKISFWSKLKKIFK